MENKCYMIDLDGTMYWGVKPIPGAKEWIDSLIRNKIPFLFLTNNASRTPEEACAHMLKMGFRGVTPAHFYTSAMAAADAISLLTPHKKKAYYIGENGMRNALLDNGFIITSNQPDYLFVGLDRGATYSDYSHALKILIEGATLVATNDDRMLLTESGPSIGNGSVVAMFEYASSTKAIKIGKPHSPIIEGALRKMMVAKEDVIILGDNLETDILCGNNAGIDTILVTTGVHTMEDCHRLQIFPTYIMADCWGFFRK